MAVTAAALLAAVERSLDPQPRPAREWMQQELAKAQYADRTSLAQQVVDWVQRHLSALTSSADRGSTAFSPVVTVVLALVVLAGLAWVIPRIRRERRARAVGDGVLDGSLTPAEVYRARAAAALRDGHYDVAVVEGFRAIAREATDRTLLSGAPGQTAHEIGLVLRGAFPASATRLLSAADLFDAVRYGRLLPSRSQAEEVQNLDTDLARQRPATADDPAQRVSLTAGRR